MRVLFIRPSWTLSGEISSGAVGGGTLALALPSLTPGAFPFSGGQASALYFEQQYAPRAMATAAGVAPDTANTANAIFTTARDVLLGASPALVLMVVLGLSKIFAAVG